MSDEDGSVTRALADARYQLQQARRELAAREEALRGLASKWRNYAEGVSAIFSGAEQAVYAQCASRLDALLAQHNGEGEA